MKISFEELKSKVKEVMLNHLKTKGYPNMAPAQILAELKPLWIAIEEAGLIQSGMSFQVFTHTAHQVHTIQQQQDIFEQLIRGHK